MTPDVAAARAFLARLDPGADRFTFQVYDDSQAKRPDLARTIGGDPSNGVLDELAQLNVKESRGVFVTVNATDATGRRQAHNVQRVRAVFVDLDGAPLAPVLEAPLAPHIVAESSPGRWHAYWLVDDCPLEQFPRVQKALAHRFGGDPVVHDLPRVMRLPGFLHRKGEAFVTRVVPELGHNGAPYTLAEIVGTLQLVMNAAETPHVSPVRRDGKVTEPGRNAHLFALGRSMAKKGLSREGVLAALTAENATRCSPTLADERVAYIAERAFSARDADAWQDPSQAPQEGLGARIAEIAPTPIDLLRPISAPPLRASDVPDVLGRFADVTARASGFDISILLASGVMAAAAMLSDQVRLCVAPQSNWFESGRLWTVIIGGAGAGKSPGMKAMLAPVFKLHRELLAEWSKLKAEEPELPMPALYTSDATTEAMADLLAHNERGLLFSVDELESWLCSHDAYRTAGGRDRGEWLRLYDGGPHHVLRVKRGPQFIPNWGASLLSATTPAALHRLAPKLPDDGLLQRFLVVVARAKEMPEDSSMRFEALRNTSEWDAALRRLHAIPPGVVRLSAEAKAVFREQHLELHHVTQAFDDVAPAYASHLAKRPGMLARLALVFHALAHERMDESIGEDTMRQAARFLRRQERHAQAVYGAMTGSDTGIALAKAIAVSILAGNLHEFNRRDLAHGCKAFRGAEEPTRQAALLLLRDCGWLTTETSAHAHGARWMVDARVHELFAAHGEAAKQRRDAIRHRMASNEDDDE